MPADLVRVMDAFGIGSNALLGQGGESWVLSLDDERIVRVNRTGTSQAQVAGRSELPALVNFLQVAVPD